MTSKALAVAIFVGLLPGCMADGAVTSGPEPEPLDVCPLERPAAGDPCDIDGRSCLYGGSFDPDGCSQRYACDRGAWAAMAGSCDEASCPDEPPGDDDECDAPGLTCRYAGKDCASDVSASCGETGLWMNAPSGVCDAK